MGPTSDGLTAAGAHHDTYADLRDLPKVHIRTYSVQFLASTTHVPEVALEPMGPFLDLVLRRHMLPDPEHLKQALRQPKLMKKDIEKGLGKKRKNLDVDEMGDLRGRIHVGKHDISGLKGIKGKKMKGLRGEGRSRGWEEAEGDTDKEKPWPKKQKSL